MGSHAVAVFVYFSFKFIYSETKHNLNWWQFNDGFGFYSCAFGLFVFRRSQEDLLALLDAHISIAGLCHDKTRALQYLAGEAALKWKSGNLKQNYPSCSVTVLSNLTLLCFSFKVSLVHGGHVLDSADLEVVESLAKICLSTVSPLGGKGPQILTDFISHHGNFGNHTTFLKCWALHS